MIAELLAYYFATLAGLLVIVNPLSSAFVYASIMTEGNREQHLLIAKRAAITASIIFIIFALLGNIIFTLFGISIPAFKIAGGIILFGIAMGMIQKQQDRFTVDNQSLRNADLEDLAIIPLAIPFISGPGSIATIMIYSAQMPSELYILPVIIATLTVTTICYYAMRNSHHIVQRIGPLGKRIATKVFGLILAVIAVQFIINGIMDLLPIISSYF